MPDAPAPESLPTWHERLEPLVVDAPEDLRRWVLQPRPIDSRYVTWVNPIAPEKLPPRVAAASAPGDCSRGRASSSPR